MTVEYNSLYFPPAPTTLYSTGGTITMAGGTLPLTVYKDPLGIFPTGNNGSATIIQPGFYRIDGFVLLTDVGGTPNPPTADTLSRSPRVMNRPAGRGRLHRRPLHDQLFPGRMIPQGCATACF